MNTTTSSTWWRAFCPTNPLAKYRLLCLHHAGGSARTYRSWQAGLPKSIELLALQLPGREERIEEEFITDMPTLVNRLVDTIPSDLPYIIFGHSMGATIAYELCHQFQQQKKLPIHLIISAQEAPHRHHSSRLYQQTNEILLNELRRLGATPTAFFEHQELRELILPIIRSDYQLIETYQPSQQPTPLACPITVFFGQEDTELSPHDVSDWQYYTLADFRQVKFTGGHFYLIEQQQAVLNCLRQLCVESLRL